MESGLVEIWLLAEWPGEEEVKAEITIHELGAWLADWWHNNLELYSLEDWLQYELETKLGRKHD